MGRDWETTFRNWARPPGQTEQDRCENAIRAVRQALNNSPALKDKNCTVFLQGSYRNNTNVRQDSDVDVGVLCADTFFMQLPDGYSREHFGISPATYEYATFKNDIQQALESYFGAAAVTRGNKAFDIKANTYRVEADVAAFFEHRRYSSDGRYLSGVELKADNNNRVINWA